MNKKAHLKQKYLVVIHGWHVSSNGFDVHEVEATSSEEAHTKGYAFKGKRERTFDKCAMKVIALEKGSHVKPEVVKQVSEKTPRTSLWAILSFCFGFLLCLIVASL